MSLRPRLVLDEFRIIDRKREILSIRPDGHLLGSVVWPCLGSFKLWGIPFRQGTLRLRCLYFHFASECPFMDVFVGGSTMSTPLNGQFRVEVSSCSMEIRVGMIQSDDSA